MKSRPSPISDRVRSAMLDADPNLVREVEMLERFAAGNVSHVAANGRHPKDWSVERWLAVLTFSLTIGGAIIGAIWLAGGEWRAVQEAVALVPVLVSGQAETRKEVEQVASKVQEIQSEQRRVMRELAEPEPPPRVRTKPGIPMGGFPRSEQGMFGARE